MSACEATARSTTSRPNWCVLCALWLVPLVVYLGMIGRWSLSGDEYYTYEDASKPVLELLSYERKPLYYLICHVLLNLNSGVALEFLLRFPAALAASLIPPVFYGMLHFQRGKCHSVFVALVALANPWLMEMSQFARFYSLALLFATIAALALYRWFATKSTPGAGRWLVVYVLAGLLAALSHTPAGIVFPAGVVAIAVAWAAEDRDRFVGFLKLHGRALGLGFALGSVAILAFLWNLLSFWLDAKPGQFGNYSIGQIIVALALFGGISSWALAVLPLLKPLRAWNSQEVFLSAMVLLCTVPLLLLVPFGGGVAARYLIFGLPCMFVLAGRHWETMHRLLPSWGYRAGLAVGLFAFNFPYLASIASDGDHYDYRGIAREVDALGLDNPLVLVSSHRMYGLYGGTANELIELGTFEGGVPRQLIAETIERAQSEERPLVLVSKEDRSEISSADQAWLFSRFALTRCLQSKRFDHRRFRMAIYQYRPQPEGSGRSPNVSVDRALAKQAALLDQGACVSP